MFDAGLAHTRGNGTDVLLPAAITGAGLAAQLGWKRFGYATPWA
ncbi:MAG: hypothetical protein ACRDRH_20045 [Pseudonocardia sp.]